MDVSKLQSGIRIANHTISGTLHYVKNYTGFSGTASEQKGNYLALKVDAADDVTRYYELVGAKTKAGKHKFDAADKLLVVRISDPKTQQIKITFEKGGKSISTTYSLSGLVCEADA